MYCRAKCDLWLYWYQNPDTFEVTYEVYSQTECPNDHERWINQGFQAIDLKKGEGVELSTEVETDTPNEDFVALFPEQFELVSEERK